MCQCLCIFILLTILQLGIQVTLLSVWQEINFLHSVRLLNRSILIIPPRLAFVSCRWLLMLLINRNLGLPLRLSPSRWLLMLLIHRNLGLPLRLSPFRWLLMLLIHRNLGLPLRLSPSRWLLVLLIHCNLGLPLRLSPSMWLLMLLIHRNLGFPCRLVPLINMFTLMAESSSRLYNQYNCVNSAPYCKQCPQL